MRLEWAGNRASSGRYVALARPSDIRRDAQAMPTLTEKHHPRRFTEMSPFMAAIVAFVLGESWTDPAIDEVTVSEAEDLVYVRKVGAVGFDGLQSLTDLRNNWNCLIDAAGLTPDERREAVALFRARIETLPGTQV
jgi:hypothetical protein